MHAFRPTVIYVALVDLAISVLTGLSMQNSDNTSNYGEIINDRTP